MQTIHRATPSSRPPPAAAVSSSDPLAIFTTPPPNETAEERVEREAKEAEEKRVSDEIDEGLKKDKAAMKKERENVVKVLLLGQAESGKSTTLKNFRLRYTRKAWTAERSSWRAVIQLNIIRSIITILDAIDNNNDNNNDNNDDPLTDEHRLLKLRLAPLHRIEADLKRHLGASTSASDEMDNIDLAQKMYATPFDSSSSGVLRGASGKKRTAGQEVVVRSWTHVLQAEQNILARRPISGSRRSEPQQQRADNTTYPDEATEVIAGCKEDMKSLWEDRVVQDVLGRGKVKLADSAPFFLSQLDRIAIRSYEPSDDDVIRARLRTLGVQEHRLKFEGGVMSSVAEAGRDWIIYDVGGSRTMRAAWLPYFEDINAIIFIAPISCFDEQLTEDPSINRLQDSFILFRSICSSKQLANVTLIVFLNKCDLLEEKLKKGVSVKKHLPSFGERNNDSGTVIKYLKQKFKETSHQCSPSQRTLYLYATSVTDTSATAVTLKSVRDGILRDHLKQSEFV